MITPREREKKNNQQTNYYHFCCSVRWRDISTGEELAELDRIFLGVDKEKWQLQVLYMDQLTCNLITTW